MPYVLRFVMWSIGVGLNMILQDEELDRVAILELLNEIAAKLTPFIFPAFAFGLFIIFIAIFLRKLLKS